MGFGRIRFKMNRRRKGSLRLSKGPLQTSLLILESFFVLFDFLQIFTSLDNDTLDNTHGR